MLPASTAAPPMKVRLVLGSGAEPGMRVAIKTQCIKVHPVRLPDKLSVRRRTICHCQGRKPLIPEGHLFGWLLADIGGHDAGK